MARTPTLFAFLACLFTVSFASAADRPNFVVFIADDVSWNDFGCYGNEGARTPRIDALAADGMQFSKAYLTASSCSPSRCSIITGRYPHNNGAASELHRPLPSHLIKFPKLLREAGYYTALAGKDHMPQDSADEDAVWDEKRGIGVPGNTGGEGHWVDIVQKRPKDKPFFFWFAATDAHRGWNADREWKADQYGEKHDPSDVEVPPYLRDTPETRDDLASYHNEITRFDYYIGQVVDELKKQNVLDNTLIFVMADNGRPFPRAKTRVHDSGMKTPFVLHWPAGIEKPGTKCDRLVSVIDICPTVLSLAGVEVPAQVQGYSFAELLKDPIEQHRHYAFSEHNWHDYEAHGRAVRDHQGMLYIRNARPDKAWLGPADSVSSVSHQDLQAALADGTLTAPQADVFLEPRPKEELYDTRKDPLQTNNLVGEGSYAKHLAELRNVMDQWQKETGDSVPENYTVDHYDREQGYIDSKTGERIRGARPYGDWSGFDRKSDEINQPGPR
ncbi:sulfatase [Blastopirellula marina]|uniref:Heparan N-sulfatase n=1 Tax=Blastopirellula marina TaxID=124 RepID=A0A2S8GP48_9BACT|nr:sulfatase [Blastopirellula marina]PQO46197.1 heparan N-sulfatase [Blastopirellula marina]